MQILMAGVCVSNYLLRTCLGTCAAPRREAYSTFSPRFGAKRVGNASAALISEVLMVQEYEWDVQLKAPRRFVTCICLDRACYSVPSSGAISRGISSQAPSLHDWELAWSWPGRPSPGVHWPLPCRALEAYGATTAVLRMVADLGFAHTWLCLIALGLAQSPLMPTTMQLISAYVPVSERGCSIAARALSMRLGQIIASVLAPLICSQAVGPSSKHA